MDSIQDAGRKGWQSLGINPGGAMDLYTMKVVNALVGNDPGDAVIEAHFPGPAILFKQQALIAIGGADFRATINGETVEQYQPVIVNRNSVLHFEKQQNGARVYISIREKLDVSEWLGSRSTNLKAKIGGWEGRQFKKDDIIPLRALHNYDHLLKGKDFVVLAWKAENLVDINTKEINVIRGNEWKRLDAFSKQTFIETPFYISNYSDRMGYLIVGQTLTSPEDGELVSAAVNYGTIQLLPDGQMMILMADHQTTGGYPRLAHVITADLPKLAQKKAGDELWFRFIEMKDAEDLFMKQVKQLQQMSNACKLRLEQELRK